MKSKLNFAFTLAEVLVTLTIIGVVAAISIPQVSVGVQRHRDAAVVGRTTQIISGGCQNMINDANNNPNNMRVNDRYLGFSEIILLYLMDAGGQAPPGYNGKEPVRGPILLEFNKFYKFNKLSNTNATAYKNSLHEYNGTASNAYSGPDVFAEGNIGSYVMAVSVPDANLENNTDDPIEELILIDANGNQAPNRYGKDIFMFGLTDRCNMIPAGSGRMAALATSMGNTTFNNTQANGCGNNITQGLSCTSRLTKDGFRIKY